MTHTPPANLHSHCYRHRILYPLQLEPPFPTDVGILKPKVGLGPNQIEIDLRKFSRKNITLFGLIKLFFFWKVKTMEALGHAYAYTHMCKHAQALHAHALCMRTHTRAYVRMLGFKKPKRKGFLH